MKQRKKRIITIEEFLNKGKDKKEIYSVKYQKSLAEARATDTDAELIEKLNLKTGRYSMKTKVKTNPWVKSRPASKASSWLHSVVFTNPAIYRYNRRLLYQGGFFAFEYKNPKYKGTSVLPWFDKFPLVISLGPVVTKKGVRNIGFNLHLVPPKIRIIIMCIIFEMYKRLYRYQVFFKRENAVKINYKEIIKGLERYGVKFCVRMYIPNRMEHIVRFPITEWHKAIFIPSRGYDSIRANQLIKEWRLFCRRNGFSTNPNMDWKSIL
jgi:hypothetical protein